MNASEVNEQTKELLENKQMRQKEIESPASRGACTSSLLSPASPLAGSGNDPSPRVRSQSLKTKILPITALPAQISASNFHDLTQITQRRVCFNPKRTVFRAL